MKFKKYIEKANFFFPVSLLFISLLPMLFLIFRVNQGNFIYITDDAYIHLAIVKNFVEHFIWGVTKFEFVSASSSILYPLILAVFYKFFQLGQYSNFVLDLALALFFLYILYKIFIKEGLSQNHASIATSCFIFLTPLISNIFVGLEHILQIVVDLCFFYFFTNILSSDRSNSPTDAEQTLNSHNRKWRIRTSLLSNENIYLMILSTLVTAVRYEGMFIIAAAIFLLFMKKQFGLAFLVFISGALPILIFGYISMLNNNFLLPNTLLMKSSLSQAGIFSAIFKDFGIKAIMQIMKYGYIMSMLLISISVLIFSIKIERRFFTKIAVYNMMFILVLLMHLQYSIILTYTSMRYEFYLIGIFIFIMFISIKYFMKSGLKLPKFLNKRLIIIGLVLVSISPIFSTVLKLYFNIPQISNNIYCQQYQMAKFIEKNYQNRGTIACDIGAVDYFGNSRNIDLEGLGSVDIVKAKRSGNFNTHFIDSISKANKTEMIVLFKDIYIDKIPKTWIEVASWRLPDNYICSDEKVTFFAIDSNRATVLKQRLIEFKSSMPDKVEIMINYSL
ncbi:MAG: hypothetical protein NT007_11015 [Candidatus Kapabacteria bacterium]|nr:hypothetical protein [Candidatus Kapabacteria bacterium]